MEIFKKSTKSVELGGLIRNVAWVYCVLCDKMFQGQKLNCFLLSLNGKIMYLQLENLIITCLVMNTSTQTHAHMFTARTRARTPDTGHTHPTGHTPDTHTSRHTFTNNNNNSYRRNTEFYMRTQHLSHLKLGCVPVNSSWSFARFEVWSSSRAVT